MPPAGGMFHKSQILSLPGGNVQSALAKTDLMLVRISIPIQTTRQDRQQGNYCHAANRLSIAVDFESFLDIKADGISSSSVERELWFECVG